MKKYWLLLLSVFLTVVSYAQVSLGLTDVMVYKSDGMFENNDNWQYTEAQAIGIYKRKDTQHYMSFGQRKSVDIVYWTWIGEKYVTQPGFFADTNKGMSAEMKYSGDTMDLFLVNNSRNYLLVKLDNVSLFYCENKDEGVTYQMLPGVGNNLRNTRWNLYDYALVPPGGMAIAEFKSLMGQAVFPASLPSKTIIQASFYGAFSEIDPWDRISSYTRGEEAVVEGVKFFTLASHDYSNIVSGFNSSFVGFESRYHFKVR